MDSETIDAVTDWETVVVGQGYRGLHDLADAGFTGAVTDGLAWAFALNGRVVGVFEGSVEDFEGADLTAYEAPDSALPLLYAMRERGGETQAKYYTQEMSLGEADETLRSGNFTGYVRLSENVLSGDYYVVYYGGKSMSVAFVGNSRRLLTGDEAFERADDEVGIYEVVDVDVDIVELPDAPDPEPEPEPELDDEPTAGTAERSAPADGADEADDASAAADDAVAPEPTGGADAADETSAVTFGGGDDADATAGGDADPAAAEAADPDPTTDESAGEAAPEPTGDADAPAEATDAGTSATEATDPEPAADDGAGGAEAAATDDGAADPSRKRDRTPASAEAAAAADDDVFSEEEEWREARAIPSLDPAQTEEGRADTASGGRAAAATETKRRKRDASAAERERPSPPQSVSRTGSASESDSEGSSASRSRSGSRAKSGSASAAASRAEATDDSSAAGLRERLEKAAAARERLEAERDELEAERDEYREEAERLRSRVEELEAEIDRLESRLSEASAGDGATSPDRTMSAAEALTGTNLFIRYDSKADPTLEDAHGGGARRDEVNDNLRVEHHTQFDTDGLRVDGKPFEEFLRDTIEYRFVNWVVRDLLYDVQATRARSELQDLYDVVPRIDRVEIDGTVSVSGDDAESEEATGEEESFDVVLWDGRGNPLVVADLNTSRDPATESMVTSLISDASAVGESHDTLGAAFYVTASYFEPGALDAVGDATGGGLLSRNKRKSFVKLARKQGFHLCLVEARNREFHVSVPDL